VLGQPQIEVDSGFAGGTSAKMALACGQKRSRFSAGKALAAGDEALPGGGRLKSRCPVWELEKAGGLCGSCSYKSHHPTLCDRWQAHWRNLRDPDGNNRHGRPFT
jgi:hypothetical protein